MNVNSPYFLAISSLNKVLVLGLARCDYINRNEKVIPVGNSGTGKTHIALALGLEAHRKVRTVDFITASTLVHELPVARDEKRLLKLRKQLAHFNLLIIRSAAVHACMYESGRTGIRTLVNDGSGVAVRGVLTPI